MWVQDSVESESGGIKRVKRDRGVQEGQPGVERGDGMWNGCGPVD